jgi:tRNA(Ile)-lysidine synthase
LKDCPDGTVFLAAVSGGADSMALLAALCAVIPKDRLFCLHVEHGLRPAQESRGDAEHVRNFCENNGIDCRVVSIPPGKVASFAQRKGVGIEAAARYFRRRLLFRHAARLDSQAGLIQGIKPAYNPYLTEQQTPSLQGGVVDRLSGTTDAPVEKTRILTAHTKDDALELSLMRVLRGAGPAGLAAMPASRGRILRPMLKISRTDVIQYLTERNILWREDSTNTDEKFLRNRVRRRLIPLLNEFFPEWKTGLSGLAATQSLVAEYFSKSARKRITWEHTADGLVTDEENFFSMSGIIREEALFAGIDALSSQKSEMARSIKRSVIRRFCSGLSAVVDLGPLTLRRKSGKVALSPKNRDFSESGFSLLIKEPGLYNLNSIAIEVRPSPAGAGYVFLVTEKEP